MVCSTVDVDTGLVHELDEVRCVDLMPTNYVLEREQRSGCVWWVVGDSVPALWRRGQGMRGDVGARV